MMMMMMISRLVVSTTMTRGFVVQLGWAASFCGDVIIFYMRFIDCTERSLGGSGSEGDGTE